MPSHELRSSLSFGALGIGAGTTFDVFGKEAQASRASLVRRALDRDIDLFATAPSRGEGERVLAAALVDVRHRAFVMVRYDDPDEAAVHRQIDRSLHLFDGWIDILAIDSKLLSATMILGMQRMRDTEEALAIGVACSTSTELQRSVKIALDQDLDVISIPAALLFDGDCDAPLDQLARAGCDIIFRVPDGLENQAATGAPGSRALNLARYRINCYRDLLLKVATSDPRARAVTVPIRRASELDTIIGVTSSPCLSRTELLAIRSA